MAWMTWQEPTNMEFNGLPIDHLTVEAWPICHCRARHPASRQATYFPCLGDVGPLIYEDHAAMATVCGGGTIVRTANNIAYVDWELRIQEGTEEAALREIFKQRFLKGQD